MQVSIDGYVAGPNGEMDWMEWNWDDELKAYVGEITEPVDCIILGHKLAQGFIPHWATASVDPKSLEQPFAKRMNDTPKIVFSKTLKKSEWDNTKLANGNIVDEIKQLKKQPGNDIIVYGGANFVSNLIQEGLIDELHLFVNPAALGSGMAIFKNRTNLKLIKSQAFSCGIVVHKYEPSK